MPLLCLSSTIRTNSLLEQRALLCQRNGVYADEAHIVAEQVAVDSHAERLRADDTVGRRLSQTLLQAVQLGGNRVLSGHSGAITAGSHNGAIATCHDWCM